MVGRTTSRIQVKYRYWLQQGQLTKQWLKKLNGFLISSIHYRISQYHTRYLHLLKGASSSSSPLLPEHSWSSGCKDHFLCFLQTMNASNTLKHPFCNFSEISVSPLPGSYPWDRRYPQSSSFKNCSFPHSNTRWEEPAGQKHCSVAVCLMN